MSDTFYNELERAFVSWAQSIEDIRSAFIIGSRARIDHPADEWSDMDIIFFTSRQNYYLSDNKWLNNFGNIRISFETKTAGGDYEYLTLFDGGRQADFIIHSTDTLKHLVDNKIVPDNFLRGVKVIIDKDGIADNIIPRKCKAPQSFILSEETFIRSLNMFWFIGLYIAKQILRNELWTVKVRDANMKELLLQMIEWHEKATHGSDYDTWHVGRFICEWASEETQTELRDSFGLFDSNDSRRALIRTIDLYKRLSHDVSRIMDFRYPYDLEENIYDWIKLCNGLI